MKSTTSTPINKLRPNLGGIVLRESKSRWPNLLFGVNSSYSSDARGTIRSTTDELCVDSSDSYPSSPFFGLGPPPEGCLPPLLPPPPGGSPPPFPPPPLPPAPRPDLLVFDFIVMI